QEWYHEIIIPALVHRKFFREGFKPSAGTQPIGILDVAFSSCKIKKEVPHVHRTDLVREHKPQVVAKGRPLALAQPENFAVALLMVRLRAVYPRKYGHRILVVLVVDLAVGDLVPRFTLGIDGYTVGVAFHLRGEILSVQQGPASILFAFEITDKTHHVRGIVFVDRRIFA